MQLEELQAPRPVPPDSCIVFGFLGGRDAWDDASKGVRQTALRLRDPGARVYAETFENRNRQVALELITRALDADGDGQLGGTVVEDSRLLIYGQSLGGSAALKFARQLAALQVPVLLTVQIDSVGVGDAEVPANVRFAANLYQDNGWFVAGEQPIRAADPERTRILGNWRLDYDSPPGAEIDISDLPFWKTIFRVAHARMDRDPRVWDAVEELLAGACSGADIPSLAAEIEAKLSAGAEVSAPPP